MLCLLRICASPSHHATAEKKEEACEGDHCRTELSCPLGYTLSRHHRLCTGTAACSALGADYVESEVWKNAFCDGGYWDSLTDKACVTCQPAEAPTTAPEMTTTSEIAAVTTATTSIGQEGRDWELVGGPWNRACRGRDAWDNSPEYYELHTGIETLEACKRKCLKSGLSHCRGVEFNVDLRRCEVWHREAGIFAFAEPSTPGFTCMRFGWPAMYLLPVDGGVDRACRGENSTDDSETYYTVERVIHMEDCRARCVRATTCLGIEFSPSLGRCQIWTRPIRAVASKPGSTCLRYEPPALAGQVAGQTLYP